MFLYINILIDLYVRRYKSFAISDNIGDITAKGEAQIAVIDLLGMLLGVILTKSMGTSKISLVSLFMVLSAIDIFCIFNEIQRYVYDYLLAFSLFFNIYNFM